MDGEINETVRQLARTLIDNGLFTWKLKLENDGGPIDVSLDGFHDLKLAESDIRAVATGNYRIDLSPPPEGLDL